MQKSTSSHDIHSALSNSHPFFPSPSVNNDPSFSLPSTFPFPFPITNTHPSPLNDLAASMLDLDEDPRLSVRSSHIYDDPDDDDDDDAHLAIDDELDLPLPRMGLGPKMRFHSPAPWEIDDGSLQEDESEYPTSKKSFAFNISRSIDPRRPSLDSGRPQDRPKRSFEATPSQLSYPRGALYALAQESLSASSFVSRSSGRYTSLRKPSLNLIYSESRHNHTPPGTSRPLSSESSPRNNQDTPDFPPSHRQPGYAADAFHPYAHPDLVTSYVPDQLRHKSGLSHSNSITTVTDSVYSTSSGTGLTLTTSAPPKTSTFHIDGKAISSPVSVLNNTLRLDPSPNKDNTLISPHPPVVESLPGWTDHGIVPTFSLISLEEARAQRSRSATFHIAESSPPVNSSPVPLQDTRDGLESKVYSHNYSEHKSISRNRARSISAGAKAKHAIQSIVGGGQSKSDLQASETVTYGSSGVSGKTLRHKKSGFMRLFNSGRMQENEEKVQVPPVPSLPNTYIIPTGQVSKTTTVYNSALERTSFRSFQEDSLLNLQPTHYQKVSQSPKRPPLFIDTKPQTHVSPVSLSDARDTSFRTRDEPFYMREKLWTDDSLPQSAPAIVPDFPILKLRPISTVFSAKFGDHIIARDALSPAETDLDTPLSSSRVFSPITRSSMVQHEHLNKPPMVAPSGNQSPVTDALQEQIPTVWQQQLWELESQVRDLKIEIEELRAAETSTSYCHVCGRGQRSPDASGHLSRPSHNVEENRVL